MHRNETFELRTYSAQQQIWAFDWDVDYLWLVGSWMRLQWRQNNYLLIKLYIYMCRGRRGRWRSKQREKTRAKDSLQQTKKIFEFMSVFRRMCVAIHHHVAFSHCLLIIINQFWIFNLTYISRPSTNSDCLELRPLSGHSHPTKQNYIMLTLTHHHFLWSVFLLFQQSLGPLQWSHHLRKMIFQIKN